MLSLSLGYKRRILGAESWIDLFTGGQINLYSGAQPDSADVPAPHNNLLGVVKHEDAGLVFFQSGEFIQKPTAHTWSADIFRDGTLAWCRLIGPGDDPTEVDFDAPRIDGGIVLDNGDAAPPGTVLFLDLPTLDVTYPQKIHIDSFVFSS